MLKIMCLRTSDRKAAMQHSANKFVFANRFHTCVVIWCITDFFVCDVSIVSNLIGSMAFCVSLNFVDSYISFKKMFFLSSRRLLRYNSAMVCQRCKIIKLIFYLFSRCAFARMMNLTAKNVCYYFGCVL